jgi:hypothetical protein
MFMLLWPGAVVAVNTAITQGAWCRDAWEPGVTWLRVEAVAFLQAILVTLNIASVTSLTPACVAAALCYVSCHFPFKSCSEANSLLGPFGLSLSQASDASAAAMAFLTPLVRSTDAASQLLGVTPAGNRLANYAFQPLCPPVCLNLGSFAMFLQSSSCICGSASLNAVQNAAREGTRVGIVALAGAFAMYVAATLLLMILTGHYVEARFDR